MGVVHHLIGFHWLRAICFLFLLEDLHCRVSIEESPPESFRYRSPFCSCINQMLFHGINLFTRQTRLYQMACIVVALVLTCVCTLPKFINYRPVILKPSRLLDRLSSVWQIHVPDFTQGGFCMRLMLWAYYESVSLPLDFRTPRDFRQKLRIRNQNRPPHFGEALPLKDLLLKVLRTVLWVNSFEVHRPDR